MKRMIILMACLLLSGFIACADIPASSESKPAATSQTTPLPANTLPSETGDTQGTVIARPQMTVGRAAHTATRLLDGTVLLTGGFANSEAALPNAEIFNPNTQTFSATSSLSVARQSHTATLLPNGKVLLAGGFSGDSLDSAELYDPDAGTFIPTGSMLTARSGHVAILLDNGQVLVAGGVGLGWQFLATAEIYDPQMGLFSATGDMAMPRESHTATRLPSGEVLIAGGHQGRREATTIYDSAELYDPERGAFRLTGAMTVPRHKHDAMLLADGRVFISGGADERDAQGVYRSTEIFDPATETFTLAGDMHYGRYKHTGTSLLLPNGQVILVGGANTAEIYDPQSGTFHEVPHGVGLTRLFATATILPGGDILFAGGYGSRITTSTQAWVLKF